MFTQGRPPALPQRREDHDRFRGGVGVFDASPRAGRGRDHVGRTQEVLAGRMTLGSFFSFTLYLGMLVGPVIQIVSIGSQITEAFAGLERIREIRDEKPEDAEDALREPLTDVVGHVEFRDVSFEYQEGVPVLRERLVRRAAGHVDRARRTVRLRKEHAHRPRRRVLPADLRHDPRGRPRSFEGAARRLPVPARRRLPGQLPLRRHGAREHRLREARRAAGGGPARRPDRPVRRLRPGDAGGLRHRRRESAASSSRAASASASRSRARFSRTRAS